MKPMLYETLMRSNPEFKEHLTHLKEKSSTHPFLVHYLRAAMKEALFSDSASALGNMQDTVVDAAWPEMIGRNIITVLRTNQAMERFPLDGGAVGYKYAEGGSQRICGKKPTKVDIYTDVLAEASDQWTKEFLEDATWNVLDRANQNVGRALGQKETEEILSLYDDVAHADLASGDELAGANAVMSWALLLTMRNAVRGENWRPNVLAINEMQLHQLLNDDKFVKSVYLPSSQTDIEQGSIGTVLGMKIQPSTLVTNGTAYAIDTRVASVMLLRRDVTVEDWEDTKQGMYGVRATTRFGIGVLRSNAIARMTGIKATLT